MPEKLHFRQRLCSQNPLCVYSTPSEFSAILCVLCVQSFMYGNPLQAIFSKIHFCYGEISVPIMRGPLGCLLGFLAWAKTLQGQLHQKNAPKCIFLHILKQKFQRVKHTSAIHFRGVLNVFAEIWRECCLIIRQKSGVRELLVFKLLSKFITILVDLQTACFINSQSLTKQTSKQNFLTLFFTERCQEDSDVDHILSLKTGRK